jgi:hypothetical protein
MKHEIKSAAKYHSPPEGPVGAANPSALNLAARAFRHLSQFIAVLAFAGVLLAGNKLAPDLNGSNATVDVIIQFQTPPTNQELKGLGINGRLKKQFKHINAVNAEIPQAVVANLENDPNVTYISPNRNMAGSLDIVTAWMERAWESR